MKYSGERPFRVNQEVFNYELQEQRMEKQHAADR